MSNTMRSHAKSLVGMNVIAYHVSGTCYHGTLHSVNDKGIYLMNASVFEHTSSKGSQTDIRHAISGLDQNDVSEAFFPFFFLPFVALAGVAAASAAAHGPYGPYGYGYGYGPYGPYGYGGYPGYYW